MAPASLAASPTRSRRATSRWSGTSETTSRSSVCTSRPISTASCTRSRVSSTRSADGAAPARAGTRSRRRRAWGGEDWFRLGDLDIGLHLVRTEMLRDGHAPFGRDRSAAREGGPDARILPATDDRLRTHVHTPAGTFPFQEWFVARAHEDEVDAVSYEGAEEAEPRPACARSARRRGRDPPRSEQSLPLDRAHPGRAARSVPRSSHARVRCVAVSPLVGGKAVSGPARPYALAHGGRHHTGPCDRLLLGPDRRARHRRDGRPGRGTSVELSLVDPDAHARP